VYDKKANTKILEGRQNLIKPFFIASPIKC